VTEEDLLELGINSRRERAKLLAYVRQLPY